MSRHERGLVAWSVLGTREMGDNKSTLRVVGSVGHVSAGAGCM